MNTKSLPLIVLGSITVAIHLIGFAAVDVGAHKFLAQSVSYRDLDLSRPTDAAVWLFNADSQPASQKIHTHTCTGLSPSAIGEPAGVRRRRRTSLIQPR